MLATGPLDAGSCSGPVRTRWPPEDSDFQYRQNTVAIQEKPIGRESPLVFPVARGQSLGDGRGRDSLFQYYSSDSGGPQVGGIAFADCPGGRLPERDLSRPIKNELIDGRTGREWEVMILSLESPRTGEHGLGEGWIGSSVDQNESSGAIGRQRIISSACRAFAPQARLQLQVL